MNSRRRSFTTANWDKGSEEQLSAKLRAFVEANRDKDVGEELRKPQGKDRQWDDRQWKAQVAEALKSKDLEDGKNLLMFAASLGASKSFVSLVKAVKERLGLRTLVRHLRESDIDGAPMLFQAASSSSVECFSLVSKVIEDTLGSSELREQLQAKDRKGRTVTFHAATSKNVEVFLQITKMLTNGEPDDASWLAVESNDGALGTALDEAGEEAPRSAHKQISGYMTIAGKVVLVDHRRMNLLHHASRYGCLEIFELVVNKAKEHKSAFIRGFLCALDRDGRTPLMCMLRQDEHDRNEASQKLKILLDNMTATSTSSNEGQDSPASSSDDQLTCMTKSPGIENKGTGLTHAAHGGPEQFELAREKICSLARDRCRADGGIDLDIALGLEAGAPQGAESEGSELNENRKKRYGILLGEAASGGYVSVLEDVVFAIKTGVLRKHEASSEDFFRSENDVRNERVKDTIESASVTNEGTLLTVAISSRRIEAVRFVIRLIKLIYIRDKDKVYDLLSACKTKMRNMTFAASIPISLPNDDTTAKMFGAVYSAIKEAANEAFGDEAKKYLRDLFLPSNREAGNIARTPLSGAMFCSNKDLFDEVHKTYKTLDGGNWTVRQLLDQIPTGINFGKEDFDLYSRASKGCTADISPTMLLTLIKAIREVELASNRPVDRQELFEVSQRMQTIAQLAAERGAFSLFRVLANDGDPVLLETIPSLLERIVDYEDNIIDVVMLAVKCARNPFTTSAAASRHIAKAEVSLPAHRNGLRRLRGEIDKLMQEVLNVLPHTVKGVGIEFATHEHDLLELRMDPTRQREHDRLGAELGFMVVQWILEPSTVDRRLLRVSRKNEGRGLIPSEDSETPEIIDPLLHAIDRGSNALAFINSPLVLDYIDLKFSRATPSWNALNPFATNVSEMYYTHHQASPSSSPGEREKVTPADILLRYTAVNDRFLQGWDEGDDTGNPKPRRRGIPHYTLLPGLQFNLAGIIGKPSAFYKVPALRFAYELMSYIVMVTFFCNCVFIDDAAHIPIDERIFYVFILGILLREMLEFLEFLPTRRVFASDHDLEKRVWTPPYSVASAISRYLFKDAWNMLDICTLVCTLMAFIFRLIALNEAHERESGESVSTEQQRAFFMAKVLLAASAPLLFARILWLSQIDDTLGPMTQIIWIMLSHLARFSVFLLVLIISSALTFYGLYSSCVDGNESYGTFTRASLSMFRAMLGDFDFDDLRSSTDCNHPDFAEDAATALLVIYLVLVAVLLLNLLIAILSTAHAEVYANAEQEFHLARAKLIQQSCCAVHQGRQPSPINLAMPVIGFILDVVGEAGKCLNGSRQMPASQSKWRHATLGAIHRLIFAVIMGSVAMVILVVLWAVSLPWIAWAILRLRFLRGESWWKSYWRLLWLVIASIVGWILAFALSIVVFAACVLGSIALWFCGVWGIWQWWNAEMTVDGRDGSRHHLVEEIVFKRQSGPDYGLRHFRVDQLLKTSTGLDMDDLVLHVKRREMGKKYQNCNLDHDQE